MSKYYQTVKELINEMFGVEEDKILLAARLREDLGLSEDDVLDLAMAIEDIYDISISDEQLHEDFQTVQDYVLHIIDFFS